MAVKNQNDESTLHLFLMDAIPLAVEIDHNDPSELQNIAQWAQNALMKLVKLVGAQHLNRIVEVRKDGMVVLECSDRARVFINQALQKIDRSPLQLMSEEESVLMREKEVL